MTRMTAKVARTGHLFAVLLILMSMLTGLVTSGSSVVTATANIRPTYKTNANGMVVRSYVRQAFATKLIADGTYTMSETKAPDGYQSNPAKIAIQVATTGKKATVTIDGEALKSGESKNGYTLAIAWYRTGIDQRSVPFITGCFDKATGGEAT